MEGDKLKERDHYLLCYSSLVVINNGIYDYQKET